MAEPVTTMRLLAYGLMGLPLAFAALPIYVHVPPFYAANAGLDLALLGGILLAARLLDAGIDPWLGWLADRVDRVRMLGLSLLPLGLGFFALFHPPGENAAIWLLGSLALTYTGFSAASVAYQAWGAHIGHDAELRTRLTAAREGLGLLGIVLAASLPGFFPGGSEQGVASLSWLLPPLLILAWYAATVAFPSPARVVAEQQPWRSALRLLWGNDRFRTLLAVFVANGIASALPATLFLFFVADVLQAQASSGPLLALFFVAGALSLPGWVALAGRWGRVRTWLLAMLMAMASFAGTLMLGAGDLPYFAAICLLSGLALGADLALPAAMVADIGERLKLSGACFGLWNFAAKLNLALAAGLSLPLLAQLDYVPGQGSGLQALGLAYALLPLLFKSLAFFLLWRGRHLLEIR